MHYTLVECYRDLSNLGQLNPHYFGLVRNR